MGGLSYNGLEGLDKKILIDNHNSTTTTTEIGFAMKMTLHPILTKPHINREDLFLRVVLRHETSYIRACLSNGYEEYELARLMEIYAEQDLVFSVKLQLVICV